MPTPARRAAFEILLRVETQSSFASELLHGALTQNLAERDAAFCTELVMGTLRWQGTLDFVAQQFVQGGQKSWARFDPEVRVVLRLGLYQLRHLGGVAARAAIYESVELVKAARKSSAAGLVNAVLRKGADVPLVSLRPASMNDLDWTSIELSHPIWMLRRWSHQFGALEALARARADNEPAVAYVRANSIERSIAEWAETLRSSGIETRPGNFLKSALAVTSGNVSRREAVRNGELVIQDEASQMVPHLLDVRTGHKVLDLCAAPGNKTGLLAQWAGTSGAVVACDVHLHRLRTLRSLSCEENVLRVVADGEQVLPFRKLFDRVLVDAPCSGTGTLRRNPEIKWRLKPDEVSALAEKQLRLLENAAQALLPDGRLIYSTCSMEREENQSVVTAFLSRNLEFRIMPLREDASRLRPFFHPRAEQLLNTDFLETSPARDSTDGFFSAILVRKPAQ